MYHRDVANVICVSCCSDNCCVVVVKIQRDGMQIETITDVANALWIQNNYTQSPGQNQVSQWALVLLCPNG